MGNPTGIEIRHILASRPVTFILHFLINYYVTIQFDINKFMAIYTEK